MGGGFSINQGEQVNFNGSNKNYLNIAHGANKSVIDGVLNANSNNVFLINANGVLITKNGQVNANRFVASTSSISNDDMTKFANMQKFEDGLSFSPVFKPNKGNVVNLGNIKTLQDTTLIGENILNEGSIISKYDKDNLSSIKLIGKNIKNTGSMNTNYIKSYDNTNQNKLNIFENTGSLEASQEIDLKANESILNKGDITTNTLKLKAKDIVLDRNIDLENNSINTISADNINLDATNSYIDIASIDDTKLTSFTTSGKVETYLDAKGYYYNPNSFLIFDKFNNPDLTKNAYVSLNDVTDWWYFAKGWNDHHDSSLQADFRNNANQFKLTNNIDFGGDKGKNYANYCIDGLGCTSMIVGISYYYGFNKNFDGQGYTLSNINIDTTDPLIKDKPEHVGIFGVIDRGEFKNINVNYKNGSIKGDNAIFAGGFAGWITNGTLNNIVLNNIGSISDDGNAGGFAGGASGTFNNIVLNNIGSISGDGNAGGFTGYTDRGTFENIVLNNIGSISARAIGHRTYAGGFAGKTDRGTFENIVLNNIGSIFAGSDDIEDVIEIEHGTHAGGFAGWISDSANSVETFNNIVLNNIGSISASGDGEVHAGGFAGETRESSITLNNIVLNNIENISASGDTDRVYAGGFIGEIYSGTLNNIVLNNIGSISASNSGDTNQVYAGGFAGEVSGRYGTLNNIVLNNIGSISASSDNVAYAGGFAGWIGSYLDFTNIYLYFNPSAIISGDSSKGIFAGAAGGYVVTVLTFNNINLYYGNGQFAGIENIGNKGNNLTINDENEISKAGTTYGDFRDDVFKAFSRQEGLVEIDCGNGKKCLSFASDFEVTPPNITPPNKPSIPDINIDPDVSDNIALEADDLYLDTIQEEILAHLYLAYNIDLNQLTLILDKLNSLNDEASKIDFLTKYLLKSKDENEAKNLLASLNFLNAYKDNGLNINSNFKDNNAKDTYLKIASDFKTIEDNKNNFRSFIEKRLQELNTIKDNTNSLDNKKAELEKLVKAYNDFVKLINDGSYSKDSQEFITLTKKLSDLSKEIISLEQSINDDIAKLASHQFNKENGTSLSFANMPNKVNISFPILDAINNNGTNPEIPDRPDRPVEPIYPEDVNKPDQLFSQVSVLDNDEDEEANIDEAATEQRLKTCIVSDNFKTMNPCVAGSM